MAKDLFKTEVFNNLEQLDLISKEETLRFELLTQPTNHEKLEELAILLYHKGDYESSIKLYKKIINFEKNAKKTAFLGYLYFEKEDYQNAINYFEKSLELNPDDSFVYFLLGNAYSRIGNILLAVQNYDFAISLNLDIYKAHLDFGKKYESIGLKERAIHEYITAYEIDPRNKDVKNKIEKLKSELN